MRLDLHCRLVEATARRSPLTHRDCVVLTWEAVGQPDLGPLVDVYAIDHPVGSSLLHRAAERSGVDLSWVAEDATAETVVAALHEGLPALNRVVLDVETKTWQQKDRWVIRRVR